MLNLFDVLFPPREDEMVIRHTPDDDVIALLAPRLAGITRPGTVVLLPFSQTIVRSAIHEAKYHGSTRAFKLLALALAEYLRDADDASMTRFDLVMLVPVPLGKERRKERGFNQVEEVARYALRNLDGHFILAPNLLERVKETQSQVSLERRQREENMHGAFTASRRLRRAGAIELSRHTYIVIDDVLTTGATLQAAIDALKEAGVEHIIPLALAH